MLEPVKKRLKIIDATGVTALAALLAAAGAAGFYPLWKLSTHNVAQAAVYQQQLTELEGLSSTLQGVEQNLKSTEGRLTESEKRLPTKSGMDDFMRQLAKVADDAGLVVDTINPRPLVDGADYKVMPIQIAGTGSYESCYKFLIGLRHMDRLTRLDDLVMQVAADKGESANKDHNTPPAAPTCQINVEISTFMAR